MAMIEVTVEDDVEGEKEYTVMFLMTSRPVPQTWEQPAEGAEFDVRLIWDAAGMQVTRGEFAAVAEEALDCYYDEMLEAAEER